MRKLAQLDWQLLLAVLLVASMGVTAIAHASGGGSAQATRQLVWLGIGLIALLVCALIDYRTLGDWAWLLFAVNGAVLALVLVIGRTVHGSKSWISLGPLNAQPSELMKVCTVLLVARLLAMGREEHARPMLLAAVAAVVAVPIGLIALQPDLGTCCVFFGCLGVFLVAAGLPRRVWVALAMTGVLGFGFLWTSVLRDYQKARIMSVLTPDPSSKDIRYQLVQSRIAIGAGGWSGMGFEAGTQSQLEFLPENDTDFVFAVVAEAWGFLGSLAVLGLYAFIVACGLNIAANAKDAFGTYLVVGIMSLLAIHVLVNLGMVIGVLPTIGIPLPLMSYGGSSVVATLAGIGLVLNVGLRRLANG